ncbi:hypothetical protein [Brevundimonas sp.]|uniref:hypothetical protein n=1 Tax=Brevundimonas sp. TaxID=1871086 RepID=UPI003A916C9F
MTDNHHSTAQDDIAYMRAMAQEGRQAPLLNGPILVAAGLIFGVANLVQWAIVSDRIVVDPVVMLWVWLTAGVVFTGALIVLIRRASRKPGYGSTGNKAVGAAWSALGFGIFVMWLSLMAVGFSSGNWELMWAMPSIVATTYGTAWMVSSAFSSQRWMTLVGLVSYAGAIACGALIGNPAIYLVFSSLMVLTGLVPGLALMRQEPAEVI